MDYNQNNVFAKILKGEIPNDTVYENNYVLAFNNINPKANIHIVVIPKGEYSTFIDFNTNASEKEIIEYSKSIAKIIEEHKISEGCQILSNCGENGGQEVFHFHTHILSGKKIKLD